MTPQMLTTDLNKRWEEILMTAKDLGVKGADPKSIFPFLKNEIGYVKTRVDEKSQRVDSERLSREPDLQNIVDSKQVTLSAVIRDWNSRSQRFVQNLHEAHSAIKSYDQLKTVRMSWRLLFTALLFSLEFLFGYWIFKTFVLPDPGLGNEFTSLLVGGITVLVGYLFKVLPDNVLDPKTFQLGKRILGVCSIVFSLTFIVLLAGMRQVVDSPTVESLDFSASFLRYREFLFQLSLLFTLLFSSAYFSLSQRMLPMGLLRQKSTEGTELLEWIASSAFPKLEAEESRLNERLAALKLQAEELNVLASHTGISAVRSLLTRALRTYVEGTKEYPVTDTKIKRRQEAEQLMNKSESRSFMEVVES